jgi:hypothetical protein
MVFFFPFRQYLRYYLNLIGFEVLMLASMKMAVFRVVAL